MKDDLVYLPKADKVITLDDVESIECWKNPENDCFKIYIKKRDSNILPPKLEYENHQDMFEDFQVIVDDINKSKQKM